MKKRKAPRGASVRERLEFYSERMPNGCLEWTANRYTDGNGQIKINGKPRQVHRVTWEQEKGPIPEDVKVLHKCDNPSCRDIKHLKLGTIGDNNRDRAVKGRSRPLLGEDHPNTSLTEAQVRAIRYSSEYQDVLAEPYSVSQTTISRIQRRARWAYLED